MALKLYSFQNDYRALKALIAGQFNGVPIEVPAFEFPGAAKRPEFKEKNPLQKVPVLETPEGCIFESNAIARFIARVSPAGDLLGKSFYEQGLVDQWMDFCTNELEPPRDVWIYPLLNFMKYNAEAAKAAKKDFKAALQILNNHLRLRSYLVGESVTLADITIACALIQPFQMVLVPGFRKSIPYVVRWFNTIVNQPQARQILGDIKFATKEVAPPKEEGGKKKGKKGKGQQQASGKKKGKEQPAQQAQLPKKKPKNPLDLLPPTKLNLDNLKRDFSNNPWEEALQNMYKDFDPAGWSLWIAKYNYDDDNKVDFMTSNLASGWLARLESLRKYGFGAVTICNNEKPFCIRSAWLIRGPDMCPELGECPDSEWHTFTKIDFNDPAAKAKWEEYMHAEVVDGMPVYERKMFK